MNKFVFAAISTISIMVSGCATYVAKQDEIKPSSINWISIKGGNLDSAPRIFMTDGIVTIKGDYTKFDATLISKYEASISAPKGAAAFNKKLVVTISSISCGGSFINNCTMTANVLAGGDIFKTYSTENHYGYGWPPVVDKAMADISQQMASDSALNNYIFGR
jgi:hypothetical protein